MFAQYRTDLKYHLFLPLKSLSAFTAPTETPWWYTVTILTREHYRASDLILVIAQGPEDRRQTGDQWDGCAHLPGGDAAGRDAGLQPTGHVEPGPHPHHQRAGRSLQVRRWLLQVIRGDRWANALRKCRKRLQKVDHICSWDCRSHFCFGIHSKITFL